MKPSLTWLLVCLSLVGWTDRALSFALLGPLQNRANGAPDPWQGRPYGGRPAGLGYGLPGDIGGPVSIQESYRWNIPVITYGFDSDFVGYFGQAGVDEVEKAVAIFNALPPASKMSSTLEEFPLDVKRMNFSADTLGLISLKSYVISLLLEQLGLASPERFVWSLRSRDVSAASTNYVVLNLNYDPQTLLASSRINQVTYNYRVLDGLGASGDEWASAVEWYQFDPNFLPYSSVAGGLANPDFTLGEAPDAVGSHGPSPGQFCTGLTRDDVGGLRFLLGRENRRWEPLLPGVTGTGSNLASFVNIALRPGVDKVTFQRMPFNPAAPRSVTNIFADIYYTNDVAVTQTVQRVVTSPDILFRVRDLGGTLFRSGTYLFFVPYLCERTGTSNWISGAALNQRPGGAGPGLIAPPIHITFNQQGRYTDVLAGQGAPLWGAFDESEAPPVLLWGDEINLSTVIVESRLVQTVNGLEAEWTMLRAPGFRYRIDVSTDLINWDLFTYLEVDWNSFANAYTLRYPVSESRRFLRITKVLPEP